MSRDHRSDRPQMSSFLCTPEGVAVEVFKGNLGDPSTLANQVGKLRISSLKRIVLVGDAA